MFSVKNRHSGLIMADIRYGNNVGGRENFFNEDGYSFNWLGRVKAICSLSTGSPRTLKTSKTVFFVAAVNNL